MGEQVFFFYMEPMVNSKQENISPSPDWRHQAGCHVRTHGHAIAPRAGAAWRTFQNGVRVFSDALATPGNDGNYIIVDACCGPTRKLPLLRLQVFLVEEVVKTDEEQTYLKLADGRGWAFTHSSRDGRQLCEKLSPEEAGETIMENKQHDGSHRVPNFKTYPYNILSRKLAC